MELIDQQWNALGPIVFIAALGVGVTALLGVASAVRWGIKFIRDEWWRKWHDGKHEEIDTMFSEQEKEIARLRALIEPVSTQLRPASPPEASGDIAEIEKLLLKIKHHTSVLETEDLLRIGNIRFVQSDVESAEKYYRLALKKAEDMRNSKSKADATGNLGLIHYMRGQWDLAIVHYCDALRLHTALGDIRRQGLSIGNIGNVMWAKGKHKTAIRLARAAIKKYEAVNDQEGVAAQFGNISTALWSQGNCDEAIKHNDIALDQAVENGFHWTAATSYLTRGLMQAGSDDIDGAINSFRTSVKLSRSYKHNECEAAALCNLGLALLVKDQMEEALQLMEASLTINRRFGFLCGIASDLNNIGSVYARMGDFDEALRRLNQAFEMYEVMGLLAKVEKMKQIIRLVEELRNRQQKRIRGCH